MDGSPGEAKDGDGDGDLLAVGGQDDLQLLALKGQTEGPILETTCTSRRILLRAEFSRLPSHSLLQSLASPI